MQKEGKGMQQKVDGPPRPSRRGFSAHEAFQVMDINSNLMEVGAASFLIR